MGSPFFTKHAREKFEILKNHGFLISQQEIIELVANPDEVDRELRNPFIIATKQFDDGRVVRVMYKMVDGVPLVITFYPIKRVVSE